MYPSSLIRVTVLFALLLMLSTSSLQSVLCFSCQFETSDGYSYPHLDKLMLTTRDYTYSDTKFIYSVNVCSPTVTTSCSITTSPSASSSKDIKGAFCVRDRTSDVVYAFGAYDAAATPSPVFQSIDPFDATKGIKILFRNGGNIGVLASIELLCAPSTIGDVLAEATHAAFDDAARTVTFSIQSPYACPISKQDGAAAEVPASKDPLAPPSSSSSTTTPTTPAPAPASSSSRRKLGFWSISLIVLSCVFFLYFVVGYYMNYKQNGEHGVHNIPLIAMWSYLVTLIMDGGAFVYYSIRGLCRRNETHTYSAV